MKMTIHEAPQSVTLSGVGDRAYQVFHPFRVVFSVGGADRRSLDVPAGFLSDLGSVPRMGRAVVSVAAAPLAFVAHDWCYARQDMQPDLTRREADRLMLELMHYQSAPKRKCERWVAYWAVRIGGWVGWRRHERRRKIHDRK